MHNLDITRVLLDLASGGRSCRNRGRLGQESKKSAMCAFFHRRSQDLVAKPIVVSLRYLH